MRFKFLFSISIMFIISLSMSSAVGADMVPWTTETYTVNTWAGECCPGTPGGVFDDATGPPLPISASSNYSSGRGVATAEISDTAMNIYGYSNWIGARFDADADFSGSFIANDPWFIISLDYYTGAWVEFSIDIQDLTASTSLYSYSSSADYSDVLYIPTTAGNEISVDFGIGMPVPMFGSYDDPRTMNSSLTYGMSVVPEPISSTLFVIGGVALGFRRLRKRVS